jgi:hypothetical protein
MSEEQAVTQAIEPFRIDVSDDELADLRERLDRTRWPEALPGAEWSRGVPIHSSASSTLASFRVLMRRHKGRG